MANSAHIAIRNAIASLFVAEEVAGGRIHKNRDLSLTNGLDSQLHVNFASSDPDGEVIYTNHPRDWATLIEVTVLTRKAEGIEAADRADAIWTECYGLVMADPSLGGLVEDLVCGGVTVTDDEGDTSVCVLRWQINVMHRTANNTVSA